MGVSIIVRLILKRFKYEFFVFDDYGECHHFAT